MQELNGYIKLYRKLIRWGWYQDSVVKDLFLHFLLTASYKDFEWMGQQLKAGQLITGRRRLAEDLGFSERQIRTALKKLESTGEVTSKTTNKYTIITVVNWEDYQISEEVTTNSASNERPTKDQQKTNERPTKDQQKTNERPHLKNNKNIKNKRSSNARARVPQLSEILSFISDEGLNVDGEKFFKHYSENGWKTEDGESITDWQKLLHIWDSKELKDKSVYRNGYSGVRYLGDD